MKLRRRAILMCLSGFLILYVSSFLVLALFGGYTFVPSGHYRPLGGLASADAFVWQPYFGTFFHFQNASGSETFQADSTGYFYSPLILIEQNICRPSITIISTNGDCMKPLIPPRSRWHPTFRREIENAEQQK
jgi:hypothetical protein